MSLCSFQANLVAAFEQSLVNMTSRLRHLAETAEEKVRGLGPAREGGFLHRGRGRPLSRAPDCQLLPLFLNLDSQPAPDAVVPIPCPSVSWLLESQSLVARSSCSVPTDGSVFTPLLGH